MADAAPAILAVAARLAAAGGHSPRKLVACYSALARRRWASCPAFRVRRSLLLPRTLAAGAIHGTARFLFAAASMPPLPSAESSILPPGMLPNPAASLKNATKPGKPASRRRPPILQAIAPKAASGGQVGRQTSTGSQEELANAVRHSPLPAPYQRRGRSSGAFLHLIPR